MLGLELLFRMRFEDGDATICVAAILSNIREEAQYQIRKIWWKEGAFDG